MRFIREEDDFNTRSTWSESINPQEFYQLVQFGEVVLGSPSNISKITEKYSKNHLLELKLDKSSIFYSYE